MDIKLLVKAYKVLITMAEPFIFMLVFTQCALGQLTSTPDTIKTEQRIITKELAEALYLTIETNKATPVYKVGEKNIFKIQLMADGKLVVDKSAKWKLESDDQKKANGEWISSTEPLVIETSCDKPGFVRIIVSVFDENGKCLKDEDNDDITFEGGAGVEIEKLEGWPEPEDFNSYWAQQKVKLSQVPMKSMMVEVPSKDPNVQIFDVKVDCAGGKPVSGYLSIPKNSALKSLPAQIGFKGYGVKSAQLDDPPVKDRIVFNINAHGIENGKSDEFYNSLWDGELHYYAFNIKENANPETSYFNGMVLRVLRALEFIKSQPQWDGKTLISEGGSQGGFQALIAAGLDNDVSSCTVYKPWACDLGGINFGRIKGSLSPDFTEALGYFDPVNHAKRIKCDTFISCGLGDYTCPPSGITVVYNNLKGPKCIEYFQGEKHGYSPPYAKSFSLSSK